MMLLRHGRTWGADLDAFVDDGLGLSESLPVEDGSASSYFGGSTSEREEVGAIILVLSIRFRIHGLVGMILLPHFSFPSSLKLARRDSLVMTEHGNGHTCKYVMIVTGCDKA